MEKSYRETHNGKVEAGMSPNFGRKLRREAGKKLARSKMSCPASRALLGGTAGEQGEVQGFHLRVF